MRSGIFVAMALLAIGGAGAQAQQVDFSGKWSLSGQIIAGRTFMSFAQICDLKQTGDQLAGPGGPAEHRLEGVDERRPGVHQRVVRDQAHHRGRDEQVDDRLDDAEPDAGTLSENRNVRTAVRAGAPCAGQLEGAPRLRHD